MIGTAVEKLLGFISTLSFATAVAGYLPTDVRHPISELTPTARLHLAKTADWVAISDDAVWVGTTGPDGVTQIDPQTNTITAEVRLPGNPCAGLAVGFGALWVPLCAQPNTLARVDLHTRLVTLVPGVGPADHEGGITVSGDAVWLVVDKKSTLAKIDPTGLRVIQTVTVPRGSLNPVYANGLIWVTRSTGAEVTIIDPEKSAVIGTVRTGPKPRFAAAGEGSIWTLNQGDGTLSQISAATRQVTGTTSLRTPGHGGDIKVGNGIVWTTMVKVPLSATDAKGGRVLCQWAGPGGDSLDLTHNALWLTDFDAGDVYRFDVNDLLRHCPAAGAREHR